jgi:methionyl-tRNA formyltransferase
MVIESPPPALTAAEKESRRRKMLERHGLLRTLNKLAFNWLRSRFLSGKDGRLVRQQLFPNDAPVEYRRAVATVTVPNINAPECIAFIQGLKPDLIAVCGTTVIKPEVFTLAPRGAINIHTGITPEYRSADPIFWAIYSNQPDKVGVTIHFVDQGIDTGAIIHQRSVALYRNDSLSSVYVRCIQVGVQLYLRALEEIAAGTVRTLDRGNVKGKAFYSINLGMIQYLIGSLRFRKLKRRLPQENPATTVVEQDR